MNIWREFVTWRFFTEVFWQSVLSCCFTDPLRSRCVTSALLKNLICIYVLWWLVTWEGPSSRQIIFDSYRIIISQSPSVIVLLSFRSTSHHSHSTTLPYKATHRLFVAVARSLYKQQKSWPSYSMKKKSLHHSGFQMQKPLFPFLQESQCTLWGQDEAEDKVSI